MILSAALMLTHLGEDGAAQRIWRAVETVIREGRRVTYDLGGTTGTHEMAAAIAEEVARTN
jgi:isocitrate dehydrogenase (NAD+)